MEKVLRKTRVVSAHFATVVESLGLIVPNAWAKLVWADQYVVHTISMLCILSLFVCV